MAACNGCYKYSYTHSSILHQKLILGPAPLPKCTTAIVYATIHPPPTWADEGLTSRRKTRRTNNFDSETSVVWLNLQHSICVRHFLSSIDETHDQSTQTAFYVYIQHLIVKDLHDKKLNQKKYYILRTTHFFLATLGRDSTRFLH